MTSSPSATLPAAKRWKLAAALLAVALVAVAGVSVGHRPDASPANASSGAVIAATAIPVAAVDPFATAAPPASAASTAAMRPSDEVSARAVPVANLPPASVPIANPLQRRPTGTRTGATGRDSTTVPKRRSEYGF